jgi:PKD domain
LPWLIKEILQHQIPTIFACKPYKHYKCLPCQVILNLVPSKKIFFMKTSYANKIAIVAFLLLTFACSKTETVYVASEPQFSGSLIFNGDTSYVKSKNITIRYYSSSPCSPSNEVFYFKVTTTNFPTNAIYEWDFGDGHSAKGQYVQYAYPYGHVYTLQLFVWVNNVKVQTITTAITPFGQNVSPIASFGAQLNDPNDPNYVAFNAQSSVNTGSITNYFWDWKDGSTSSVATSYVSHKFPDNQQDITYKVKLTVTSSAGCKKDTTGSIFVPASYSNVGGISYTKTDPCLPARQEFTFTQDATGLPANAEFYWDFGDGTGLHKGNPVKHQFVYSKSYPIVCIIKINGVSQRVIYRNTSVYALGKDIIPTAVISGVYKLNAPLSTKWGFNSGSKVGDGHIINKIVWEFGDGAMDVYNRPYVEHTYIPLTANANYTVKLTVTATSGCSDSVTIPIQIP